MVHHIHRYLLAIAILSTLYTGAQVGRQIHELRTGKEILSPQMMVLLNFVGDQVRLIYARLFFLRRAGSFEPTNSCYQERRFGSQC